MIFFEQFHVVLKTSVENHLNTKGEKFKHIYVHTNYRVRKLASGEKTQFCFFLLALITTHLLKIL